MSQISWGLFIFPKQADLTMPPFLIDLRKIEYENIVATYWIFSFFFGNHILRKYR